MAETVGETVSEETVAEALSKETVTEAMVSGETEGVEMVIELFSRWKIKNSCNIGFQSSKSNH